MGDNWNATHQDIGDVSAPSRLREESGARVASDFPSEIYPRDATLTGGGRMMISGEEMHQCAVKWTHRGQSSAPISHRGRSGSGTLGAEISPLTVTAPTPSVLAAVEVQLYCFTDLTRLLSV